MTLLKGLTLSTIISASILLSGCGYDKSEIDAAKAACDNHKGDFSLILTGELITSTRCTVDGVKYRIGRTQYQLVEGTVE